MDSATLERLTTALADRYDIGGVIGRGGMATVVRAVDRKHGRAVAIKILDPEVGAALGADRFEAEIRVTASLQHPHLLPLFDSGEAADRLYYVMPLVEGESLRTRLDRERQLPLDDVVRLVRALAGALDYAHARGILHRDLKPENILLQAGQPLIADFGIALASDAAELPRITQTGYSVGTPQYMSPEQAAGERVLDGRSDQFALAAVAYEMLAGEPPHDGPTPQAIMTRLLTERPRPVHATRPGVPPAMSAVLDRALSVVPADRFPSTMAFADALATAQHAPPPTAPTAAAAAARAPRRTRRWMLAAGVLVAAAAAATWGLQQRRTAASALRLDTVLVLPTRGGGTTSLGAGVDDALAQQLGMLAGRQVRTATGAPASDDAVFAAAREAGAAYALVPAVTPGGNGMQVRLKLLDVERGTLIRQAPAVTLPADADAAAIIRAVTPIVVATGFATSRNLGPETLPHDPLPTLEAFIAFDEALDGFRRVSSPLGSQPTVAALQRAVQRDTSFLQARLWLATMYGWNGALPRRPGGLERADSVLRWADVAAARGTPHEQVLARVARSQIMESLSGDLDALRREVVNAPRSPLKRLLTGRLLELNRPHEALQLIAAELARANTADSTERMIAAGQAALSAEIWHYVGRPDSALALVRRAIALRGGTDVSYATTEFNALAALGRLDELRRRLPEIETIPSDGTPTGFPGNMYSTVSNELLAHGHPQMAREVAERGLAWFRFNAGLVRDSATVGLRMALLLQLLGRSAEAESVARAIRTPPGSTELRILGFLGRLGANGGRPALADSAVAILQALPADRLQGAPTYELATIAVNRGRPHWDEAVRLLELSFRQHAGFGIRRRLHYFTDWLPLKDYPPFRQLATPADSLRR